MDNVTPVMFITANVGSIFENPSVMLKMWTEEFLSTVARLDPKFIALHCQEVGGKNYEHSMKPVEDFVKLLMDSEELRLFDKVRVFLDEDFSSAEHFTALGNFYFVHESITDLLIWDFKEMNFTTVSGKEVYAGNIEHVSIKEKSKFPQDLFPECKWSRKGFLRTRWSINGSVFDLVNIHLFHDASNFIAMETSPSVYSVTRQRALEYTLDRFQNDSNGAVPFFLFGDFNFRTNTQAVVEKLVNGLNPVQIQNPNSADVHKLLYQREGDEVVLTLGKKEFFHSNHQQIFIENGEWLKEFDQEKNSFDGLLFEFPISFPPTYPFEEDTKSGSLYTTTRCPAWCDRVVLSSAAKKLVHDLSTEGSVEYDLMGKTTCMGDHKPVYLRANVINNAGIIEQNLSNVVNPFMLVLCACKLKKILNWQHEKRSTLASHVNKSTRLAVVEENGSLTLFPDVDVKAPAIDDVGNCVNVSKGDTSISNKFLMPLNDLIVNRVKVDNDFNECFSQKKGLLVGVNKVECGCSRSNKFSQLDSYLNPSLLSRCKKLNTFNSTRIKSKSEVNLKSESFESGSNSLYTKRSYSKLAPFNQPCLDSPVKKGWKSCGDFESHKMSTVIVQNNISEEENTVELPKKVDHGNIVGKPLNVDKIVDSLDTDEALIVNVNHRTDLPEPEEMICDETSSCSSMESSCNNQRISISKLRLDKLPPTPTQVQPSSTKKELNPCLNNLKGKALSYKKVVKRVNSASVIENKRTIVLRKTETCHCMTNSDEAWIDIFSDEYRTRSSSISTPNHNHRSNSRIKLISNPLQKTSLPRLTSHHSSSDEEWYEHILDADNINEWHDSKNDLINNNNNNNSSVKASKIANNESDKHLPKNTSVGDLSSAVNHSCEKQKLSSEKLNFPPECKLLIKLKRKKNNTKTRSCKNCKCCVIL